MAYPIMGADKCSLHWLDLTGEFQAKIFNSSLQSSHLK